MYNRVNANRYGLKDEFVRGVKKFVKRAIRRPDYLSEGGIRCPCVKCECIKLTTPPMVRYHLYKHGFKPNYLIWTDHGEVRPNIHTGGDSNNSRQRTSQVQTQICETGGNRVDEAMKLQLSPESTGSCSHDQVATLQHGSMSLEVDSWDRRVEETTHNVLVVARETNKLAQKVQNGVDCLRSQLTENMEALERQYTRASCSSSNPHSHRHYG